MKMDGDKWRQVVASPEGMIGYMIEQELGSKAAAYVRTHGCSAAHNAENTKPVRACPLKPEQ